VSIDAEATENKVIEIVSEQMGVDKAEISRETSFINELTPILWIRWSW